MKNSIEALKNLRRQQGKILEVIIVIAIIAVLVLMWQTGVFSSGDSSNTSTVNAPQPAASVKTPTDTPAIASQGAATVATSREPTQAAKADVKTLEPIIRKPSGKEPESISALTDRLIAAHPMDLTACEKETDPVVALNCADVAQNETLQAIFSDYKALRDSGDQTATARGGEVIKRATQALQAKIQKFGDAAK